MADDLGVSPDNPVSIDRLYVGIVPGRGATSPFTDEGDAAVSVREGLRRLGAAHGYVVGVPVDYLRLIEEPG